MTITIGRIVIDGSNAPNGYEVVTPPAQDRPNIPNWNPAAFEAAVAAVLRQVERVPIGGLVLQSLQDTVRIEPFTNLQNRNADADSAANDAATYNRGYRAGAPMLQCGGSGQPIQPARTGTGQGTVARVRFTPGQWIPTSVLYNGPTGPGGSADEVLFHELFHALRITLGIGDCRALPGSLTRYTDHSEFYAVIAENVYSSQSGRTPRNSHNGFVAMGNPANFMSNPDTLNMMRIFCQSQPLFTLDVAMQPAEFNPFRDYYLSVGVLTQEDVDAFSGS